ncbi:MAG: response regulator, partial [Candidatus Entotheonellia bacterium]
MAGGKILVVDDDQDLRTLMKIRLEGAGYLATLAERGEEALAHAEEEVFDSAIVDLRMEGMDGIALLEKLLRLQPSLP